MPTYLEFGILMDDSYEIGHRLIVVVPDKTAEAMREAQAAPTAPEESCCGSMILDTPIGR